MGRRRKKAVTKNQRVDQEVYDRIVEAFRDWGYNFAAVARAALIAPRTAKRAWELGWPERQFLPVREVLRQERELARSGFTEDEAMELRKRTIRERERRLAEVREQAAEDAIRAREQEAQGVRLARNLAINQLAALARLGPAVNQLTHQLAEKINDQGWLQATSVDEVTKLLTRLSLTSRRVLECGALAMKMERVLLGEPTEVIGHQEMSPASMSLDEVAHHAERARRAAEHLRSKGLTVIAGGAGGAGDSKG